MLRDFTVKLGPSAEFALFLSFVRRPFVLVLYEDTYSLSSIKNTFDKMSFCDFFFFFFWTYVQSLTLEAVFTLIVYIYN